MIRPSKFALSFTLGSMCCMSAVAMLKGPAAYAVELLQPNRLLLTSAYFVTLGKKKMKKKWNKDVMMVLRG